MFASRILLFGPWPFALILFCGLSAYDSAEAAEQSGMVKGCLQISAGQPVAGVASLWDASSGRVPDPRRFIIIPSAVASLQPDGCFALQAPPGSYYVGAILRDTPGAAMGPPRAGDRVFMTPAPDGAAVRVEVQADKVVDVGLRSDRWRYSGFTGDIETGVQGQVVDTEGRPVFGLLVFAFADQDMSGSPLAVSDRTTSEGKFQLRLDQPGDVYLRVKENYGGGEPTPGGYVGVYGGATALSVKVATGEVIENLGIVVLQVPEDMLKRRQKSGGPQ